MNSPAEVILEVARCGYSVAQTSCALCVIKRNGRIVVKVKKGFPTEEEKYEALLKAFRKYQHGTQNTS
jgi:hypothetical protein